MRFRKRIKIAPGVTLNIGKKSVGMRVGGRGYGVSANTRTGARGTVGLPGTGISNSRQLATTGNGKGCLVFVATAFAAATTIFWML